MQSILTLHNPENARDYYLSGVWQQDTLYTLARRHARERPTACALRDAELRLTWREVVDWTDSVADALHRKGLRPGDRVAIWLPNVVHTTIIFLACSRNGYVCCPSLHQNYTVDEVCVLLDRVQCRAFFGMPGYGADADLNSIFVRAAEIPALKSVFALPASDAKGQAIPSNALPFPDRQPPSTLSPPNLNPDKITYLAFTSGTTGQPKGVMHSDNTLLANGRALVEDWSHTSDTTLLTLSPMSHHIATVAVEQMLVAGCELVVTNQRTGKHALDWILETGATYVMGVPTHAMDILEEVRARDLEALGNVRTFYMAGAPIPREVAQKFLGLGVTPQNIYGMTENGSHNYTVPSDTAETIVSTCGRPCRGYEVRLWKQDNPDLEAEPGEIGEIGSRGGLLMLGYFSNQIATETSFNIHGWFMSGDLGVLDEKGCLQIVGRKKDLIIRGGHNIHPAKIEDLAMRHGAVFKAAAFPVADARLGEKVCLAVVSKDRAAIDPTELLIHLDRMGLSKFDMPEYFIQLDSLPLTASGKVLKRKLAEDASQGRIKPEPIRFDPGSMTASRLT
jgi:acyl-CoA synthetase